MNSLASQLINGTSAATPTAASVITLINDALLAAGKPVLGFLNPWIYSTANSSFTDVTNGSAIGCNTTGFPATKGWDAVTGFGTPVSLPFSESLPITCQSEINITSQYFPKLKDLAVGSGSWYESLSHSKENDLLTPMR
jgi:subtilase family serine protease